MATLPDASALDAALLSRLQTDAVLTSLMPDGVYWDLAPQGSTEFVIVSLSDFSSELIFGDADAFDRPAYLVKATARTTGGTAVKDAAARIHDLLHRQPLTLTGTGYELMLMRRVRRVRYTELDPTDQALRWQHRGGVYEILVSQ